MSHRDTFLLSFLHLSFLCSTLVQAGDPNQNPDRLIHESGGKWTGQLPNGSSTEIAPQMQMPQGPEITPHFDNPGSSGGGNSSGWGILGFFYNLGRTTDKDRRIADQLRARDIAEKKSLAGIPWDSADYAAMGTADLSKARQDPMWAVNFAKNTAPKAAPVTVSAPTTTAATVTAPLPVSTSTPSTPNVPMPSLAGQGFPKSAGVTCWPQLDEYGAMPGVAPSAALPTSLPSSPKLPGLPSGNRPEFPSLGGSGRPPMIGAIPQFNRNSNGPSGGDIARGVGGTIAGAGAIMQAGGATAGGATVTAGGTVATTTAEIGLGAKIGGALWAAAPWVAGTFGAAAIGIGIVMVYEHYFDPEKAKLGIIPTQEQLRVYNAHLAAEKAKKNAGNAKQSNPSNTATGGPNGDGPKERKFNTAQKTDALRKIKENYRFDKQSGKYRLKDNGTPIKCSRTQKPVYGIDWDGAHGDIEGYRETGHHMGSLDPENFEMYKGPVQGRKVRL